VGVNAMQAKTEISETVLCTASKNVDTHPVLCAVQECSLSSTEAACLSSNHLLNFEDYKEVAL